MIVLTCGKDTVAVCDRCREVFLVEQRPRDTSLQNMLLCQQCDMIVKSQRPFHVLPFHKFPGMK